MKNQNAKKIKLNSLFCSVLCFTLASSSACLADAEHDWANLGAYRVQNEALKSQAKDSRRVVFMGDSITEFWDKEQTALFANKAYINRGISGQTTPQMLLRFRQDVISLHPQTVVILAGTNDIAGNSGPATTEMITGNIASMAELAKAHHIKVVLCLVLPTVSYYWAPDIKPAQSIVEINNWIIAYGKKHGFKVVDYYSPLASPDGALKAEFTDDGIHPNAKGYELMSSLVKTTLPTP